MVRSPGSPGAGAAGASPGPGLEPLCGDRVPTASTDPVTTFLKALQRGFDVSEALALGLFENKIELHFSEVACDVTSVAGRATLFGGAGTELLNHLAQPRHAPAQAIALDNQLLSQLAA